MSKFYKKFNFSFPDLFLPFCFKYPITQSIEVLVLEWAMNMHSFIKSWFFGKSNFHLIQPLLRIIINNKNNLLFFITVGCDVIYERPFMIYIKFFLHVSGCNREVRIVRRVSWRTRDSKIWIDGPTESASDGSPEFHPENKQTELLACVVALFW